MKERRSFVIYHDWYYLIESLQREQVGELFFAIFDYIKNGVLPDFEDERLNGIFSFMKNTFDRDNEKYEKRCQRNAENARKRWEGEQKNKETEQNEKQKAQQVKMSETLSGFPPVMLG